MSWNPVLNKVIEIKQSYISKFGSISYEYTDKTCLELWIERLGIQEYIDLIKPLQLNQKDELLLIRYGNYSDIFNGEEDITLDEFWNKYDGFYLECRSVVINVKEDELVLFPFKKFRNLNEGEETSFENISNRIKNAKCIEYSDKLDGSMQSARCYNNKIIMAGSMALDTKLSWRLKDGYETLYSNDNYISLIKDYPNDTFIFEYISLKDSHVVNYTKEQEGLYLIGIRNINGVECSYNEIIKLANKYNIKTTKLFDKTLDIVMKELDNKKSSEAEGFVINIDGFKFKIKYNDYVNMHRMLSAISSINLIIKNIADDTFDDMLSKVPNAYRDRILKVANVVFNYIHNTEIKVNDYYKLAPKTNRKEFMIWIDNNVPMEYRTYCKFIYLDKPINYIKNGNSKDAHYKKLNEMGIVNYSSIFKEGD